MEGNAKVPNFCLRIAMKLFPLEDTDEENR